MYMSTRVCVGRVKFSKKYYCFVQSGRSHLGEKLSEPVFLFLYPAVTPNRNKETSWTMDMLVHYQTEFLVSEFL